MFRKNDKTISWISHSMVSMSIRTFKDLLIGDWAIVGKRVAVKWSILVGNKSVMYKSLLLVWNGWILWRFYCHNEWLTFSCHLFKQCVYLKKSWCESQTLSEHHAHLQFRHELRNVKKRCRDFLVLKHNPGIIVSFNLKLLHNKTSTERMSVAFDSQTETDCNLKKLGSGF